MLTKFQHDYLLNLVMNGVGGQRVERIIFAVTSANHENTRRNPVPLYLRCMAIDRFTEDIPCKIKIYPIPDIGYTDKYARYLLKQIYYQGGEKLNPQNTTLACSTPPVFKLFQKEGFANLPVEHIKGDQYRSLRPYEVVEKLVSIGKEWRRNEDWKQYASAASQYLYHEYSIGDLVNELFADSLLTSDADITDTRDYNTYALGMDNIIKIKFDDIKPFVAEGKIVDVGCSTGSLIRLLADEFPESDIIGIEAVRKFYEFCRNQEYGNPFVFFYRRNITDQNFKENSVNTFIYSSILHEVYSYISPKILKDVLASTYRQLKKGGRIVIRDVVGPENGKQTVYMKLRNDNGTAKGGVSKLSTYHKFFRFVEEFLPKRIKYRVKQIDGEKYIELKLEDAYEYLSKMSYTDNWESEMHEIFGFYSFSKWTSLLRKIGFRIVQGSKAFQSDFIVNNMYAPNVELFVKEKNKLKKIDYPTTNMILVGEK